MLFISKKQLIPTDANLAMQVASWSAKRSCPDLLHGKAIAVFLTRMQHMAEIMLRKLRRGKF